MPIKRSQTADPIRNFKFDVRSDKYIGDKIGFQKVSGLKETSEIIEYREGTDPITPRKLMGLVKYDNLVLEKGVTDVTELVDWREDVFALLSSGNLSPDTGVPDDAVRDTVHIDVVDMHGAFGWTWTVFNAWPSVLDTNEMSADANALLIDKLELAHEGFTRELLKPF